MDNPDREPAGRRSPVLAEVDILKGGRDLHFGADLGAGRGRRDQKKLVCARPKRPGMATRSAGSAVVSRFLQVAYVRARLASCRRPPG
ncbi:MAG: hypothetical protein U0797_08725 [Gemmataceae bacterium]